MESKHKNALIGALLAVVFVMAVGYAALTQQLNITGTATINDISSNWNVHFDNTQDEDTGAVDVTRGKGGSDDPSGTIVYGGTNNETATLNATLIQPGDSVTFTLTIKNYGTISADLVTPTVAADSSSQSKGSCAGTTCTFGNITYTVGNLSTTSIGANETATITVTATFNESATTVGSVTTAGITVTTNASQA